MHADADADAVTHSFIHGIMKKLHWGFPAGRPAYYYAVRVSPIHASVPAVS
jgi:hypothetical protein